MILGHYAASLAAKAVEPRVPLWHYVIAAQLIDFAWAVFVVTGIERARLVDGYTRSFPFDFYYMPFSHGLVAVVGWCVVAYIAYRMFLRGSTHRGAIALAIVVGSHWLLDLLVHPEDLPLFRSTQKVGLALWNYPALSIIVEILLLLIAFRLYARSVQLPTRVALKTSITLAAIIVAIHASFLLGLYPGSIYVVCLLVFGGYALISYAVYLLERRVEGGL